MVTPRVALNVACFTTSSPGRARATSSSVAPQRSCQGRMKRRYTPTVTAAIAATPTLILLRITVSFLVQVVFERDLRQRAAAESASLFPSSTSHHFVWHTHLSNLRCTTSPSHHPHKKAPHHHISVTMRCVTPSGHSLPGEAKGDTCGALAEKGGHDDGNQTRTAAGSFAWCPSRSLPGFFYLGRGSLSGWLACIVAKVLLDR